MDQEQNTIIESIGIYLPPQSVSTTEVLQGCKSQSCFPLEKVSGIISRRMAGQQEFSIDLAKKAVSDCLEKSAYLPADIDLLICCNISRYDALDTVSFEPCTSVKLRNLFGFCNALAFDITNACAGMFTGIYLVNALLQTGAIRRAMLVSGEYITHLTRTAQREMDGFMDPRLACLTLGDAGAALILEKSADNKSGFQGIDLQTFGRYSPYCVAKTSAHGGWIMHTDSVNLTDVAIKSGAAAALDVLQRAGWSPADIQHLVLHQTSKLTLNSAKNEINSLLSNDILHDGNTVNNLEQRGNTASTSHFIAIADQIRENKMQSGDKVVFGISASGLTVGTALYVFDDLPDRLRQTGAQKGKIIKEPATVHANPQSKCHTPGIRMESIGTLPEGTINNTDSLALQQSAATNCLENSSYQCNDIGLLIHSGVYRSDYLLEPAFAALLAGKLNMNASYGGQEQKKTLAFDVFNGSVGFLNACYVAQQTIQAGMSKAAMIVATEVENNATLFPDKLLGVCETASAVILDAHPENNRGFSRFLFHYHTESLDAYTSYCSTADVKPFLHFEKEPDIEDKYLAYIEPAVEELLQLEGLKASQIDKVFPPQISSAFIARLGTQLALPSEKFVDVVGAGSDLFSSSIPYGMAYALENGLVKPGDTGLLIAVGSGIQVGCAVYRF
ncbi:3-oxoacyl-ACP synthase [Pontibacter diazotrophicus]|uniref:3-oxoacyl-ACP synthase n=1 Tax=Pontibacter diazotrophicus TaxID=1400979 RepID=A0A3D8LD76_9BACT|nr:3-oxoacyl-[acyl-carrier-protein] synthase III C-terminal domain-containing protein [Pontibacter diazotrophicus]RDV15368.1 3-oxoacyl-ACP synthase [Pontibacter diazotrophicus]